jgi:hypothetical protein
MSVRLSSPAYLSVLTSGSPRWKLSPEDFLAPFSYLPLGPDGSPVRLVTLYSKSRTEGSGLVLDVEHALLDQNPAYAALSYKWGNPTASVSIILNGQKHAITENLAEALRHLQHVHENIVLWVDSICINQQDDVEKCSQVRIMDKIYSQADVVLSWLGSGSFETSVATKKLAELASFMDEIFSKNGLDTTKDYSQEPLLALKWLMPSNGSPQVNLYEFSTITVLLSKPYWQRLWIQQEYALGKETIVICGNDELEKSVLYKGVFASIVFAIHYGDGWSFDSRMAKRKFLSASGKILHMSDVKDSTLKGLLLFLTAPLGLGSCKAFDKRDMVYGLMSIASDREELHLLMDYKKGWQDVYREVTEAYIMSNDLTLLSCTGSTTTQSGLPTWVQDWSQQRCFISILREDRVSFYSAATSVPILFSFPQEGQLSLKGCYVDSIRSTSLRLSDCIKQGMKANDFFNNTICNLQLEDRPWLDGAGPYGKGRFATIHALLYSLTAGTRIPHNPGYGNNGKATRWIPGCGFGIMADFFLGRGEEPVDKDNIFETYLTTAAIYDRVPFVTEKGYVGIGPPQIVPGDEICLCYGAEVPYLIRRTKDGETYELHGDVYVHGIMDGEFLASEHETREFVFS